MLLGVKSAAYMPDEPQLLPFIQPQQQRTKGNRLRPRFRPAAHHRVKRLAHFQLRPTRAAVAHIAAVRPLRDNSFEPVFLRQFVQFLSLFGLMVRVAKPLRRVQHSLQKLLALEQRRLAQVVSIAVNQIEREVNHRRLANLLFSRSAHVHAVLQALEVSAPSRIQGHNFAVQNRLAPRESPLQRRQLRIARRNVNVVSRTQCQGPVRNPRHCAHAVPLNFEQPVGIGKWLLHQRRQHRLYARRPRAFVRPVRFPRLNRAGTSFRRRFLGNLRETSPC